jgi:hypothetical protein
VALVLVEVAALESGQHVDLQLVVEYRNFRSIQARLLACRNRPKVPETMDPPPLLALKQMSSNG